MTTVDVPWGPTADGLDRPYWDGLSEKELRLQRCRTCATWIWSPQSVCGTCHSFDIGWEVVQPVGTIYSWSRSWYPYIEELADRLPYVSVLVELDDTDGRRVLGLLTDDLERTPSIGDRVVGVFEEHPAQPWPLLRWQRAEPTDGAHR